MQFPPLVEAIRRIPGSVNAVVKPRKYWGGVTDLAAFHAGDAGLDPAGDTAQVFSSAEAQTGQ